MSGSLALVLVLVFLLLINNVPIWAALVFACIPYFILNDVPLSDDAELLFGGAFRGDGLFSLLDRPIFLSEESQRTAWAACRAAVDAIKANQFQTLGITTGA